MQRAGLQAKRTGPLRLGESERAGVEPARHGQRFSLRGPGTHAASTRNSFRVAVHDASRKRLAQQPKRPAPDTGPAT